MSKEYLNTVGFMIISSIVNGKPQREYIEDDLNKKDGQTNRREKRKNRKR